MIGVLCIGLVSETNTLNYSKQAIAPWVREFCKLNATLCWVSLTKWTIINLNFVYHVPLNEHVAISQACFTNDFVYEIIYHVNFALWIVASNVGHCKGPHVRRLNMLGKYVGLGTCWLEIKGGWRATPPLHTPFRKGAAWRCWTLLEITIVVDFHIVLVRWGNFQWTKSIV